MNTTTKLLAITLLVAACGDNKEVPDARVSDSGPSDAYCSDCPAAPTLGAQIDRLGRPAVNTVLNNGFTGNAAAAGTAKDNYNANSDPATWQTMYTPEFMKNLATLDALDTGLCGNGICEAGENQTSCDEDCDAAGTATTGCGNQALYNGGQSGPANPQSYQALAGVLAADELYLDTSKGQCAFYLAVEFGVVTGGANTTCGGRAPTYDVIDYSFSIMAAGTSGITAQLMPKFGDGAPAHTDYLTDFPYLGNPH